MTYGTLNWVPCVRNRDFSHKIRTISDVFRIKTSFYLIMMKKAGLSGLVWAEFIELID